MGKVATTGRFEEACRQFVRHTPERWGHPVPELGVWWRATDELDLVGHARGHVVLAAEAKWTNARVGLDVLRLLERRVALLPDVAPDRQLALFAKVGFTADIEALRHPDLHLITIEDLLHGVDASEPG